MKRSKYLLLSLLLLLSQVLYAQAGLQTDLALSYLVQKPRTPSAHPPMIILMHGYGSNEEDMFGMRYAFPPEFVVVSLRAPYSIGDNAYQWFKLGITKEYPADLKESIQKVKDIVPALVEKYKADASKVYLSGFSQGGMMSFAVGLTAPALFKGIAPLSGKIIEGLKPEITKNKGKGLEKLKIFIGHGDDDSRVEYKYAVEADVFLKQLGLHPQFHTYKVIGHSISKEEIGDLVKWINK